MMDIKLKDVSVMIGMPAGRDLPGLTVKSLIATQAKLMSRNVDVQFGFILGSSVVQWARDEVVDVFMKSTAKQLFWIDSDMVWEPEQFLRVLAINTLPDHEVVCAAYPAKIDQPTFYLNYAPGRVLTKNKYGLVEIDGMGLGFCCMQREVIENLVARAPVLVDDAGGREVASVFRIDTKNGTHRRGEDIAFFHDVRELGYKVWLDATVDLGHVGTKVYRGTVRDVVK